MRLILVPAFACDERLYESLVELLRGDFDPEIVIAEKPTLAGCAEAVLAAAGEGPFMVGGSSLGGHVAREVAFAAPERVAGLVLMGAGAGVPASMAGLEARRDAIESGRRAEMLEEMARQIVFEEAERGQAAADMFRRMAGEASDARLLAQTAALGSRRDRSAELGRLSCRTLLLWGEEDRFSLPAEGARMATAMPDAEFVSLAECGHLPSLEAPMRLAAEIRRVLAGVR